MACCEINKMALEILSIVEMAMEVVCQLNEEVYQIRKESEKFQGSSIATILKIEETEKQLLLRPSSPTNQSSS